MPCPPLHTPLQPLATSSAPELSDLTFCLIIPKKDAGFKSLNPSTPSIQGC